MSELSKVLTIPEVAKLAGWDRVRMFRHLRYHDRRLGGGLLCNVGQGTQRPKWTVSLDALKSLAPQWFPVASPATIGRPDYEDRLAAVECETQSLREQLAVVIGYVQRKCG